jgi:glycosyltransferase involved in cell wall biosynthesis
MKIAQLTPGSGDNFYCENCLRDVSLVRALRKPGNEVLMIPMYLPLSEDGADKTSNGPVFFGGINVYLQQKMDFFRKTPRWLDRIFDSEAFLRWAGKKAGMTSARLLGETTISMLQGRHGRQNKELDRLVEWMSAVENRPDIVCLSNILLSGLAGPIKKRLGVPVVCLLQDEDGFLDGLGKPYAQQAWELVRECAGQVDGFIAVSKYFAGVMRDRLGLGAEKVHVVYAGVSMEGHKGLRLVPEAPTIGYLSRMCSDRGLDVLVDAFVLIKKDSRFADARLKITGGRTKSDEPFIRQIEDRLKSEGMIEDVEFATSHDRESRVSFLQGLTVLSVPEKRPVACGLYAIEALAAGVPVVEPETGVFCEIAQETQGCVLYAPNNAETLAKTLIGLLADRERLQRLGQTGREAVAERFDIEKTAERMLGVFGRIAG